MSSKDIILSTDDPDETIISVVTASGTDFLLSFVPVNDVLFLEKWKHTAIVLSIVLLALCFMAMLGLWERLSRARMAFVIILLFLFVYTIQTFLLR